MKMRQATTLKAGGGVTATPPAPVATQAPGRREAYSINPLMRLASRVVLVCCALLLFGVIGGVASGTDPTQETVFDLARKTSGFEIKAYRPGIGYLIGPALILIMTLPLMWKKSPTGGFVARTRYYRDEYYSKLVVATLLWVAGLVVAIGLTAYLSSDDYTIKTGTYIAITLLVTGLAAQIGMWPIGVRPERLDEATPTEAAATEATAGQAPVVEPPVEVEQKTGEGAAGEAISRKVGRIEDAVFVGAIMGAAAGLIGFASLFMPWFKVSGTLGVTGITANAWEVFRGADVVLLIFALALTGAGVMAALDRVLRLDTAVLRGLATAVLASAVLFGILAIIKLQNPPSDLLEVDVGGVVAMLAAFLGVGGGTLMNIPLWGTTQVAPAPAAAARVPSSLPPAGWYADPFDATRLRYWDGTEWTGHTYDQPGA